MSTEDRPTRIEADRDAAEDERDALADLLYEHAKGPVGGSCKCGARFWSRRGLGHADHLTDAILAAGWHR